MPKDLMSAITRLEKLKQDRPRDVGVRKQLAFAFMRAESTRRRPPNGDKSLPGQATFAQLVSGQVSIGDLFAESNQPQTALNQIKLLEVLHPDLGGATLKADFLVEKQKLEKLVREQAKSKS